MIGLLVVTLFMLAGGVYWWQLSQANSQLRVAALSQAKLRSVQLTDAIVAHEEQLVRNIDQAAKTLANSYDPHQLKQFERLVDSTVGYFPEGSIFQISIINKEGYLVYSSIDSGKAVFLGDRVHFKVHLESPEDFLYVSKPIQGRVSKKWTVQFTRALRRNGQFAGVVVLSLSPDYLRNALLSLSVAADDSISIIRSTGEYVSRNSDSQNVLGRSIPENKIGLFSQKEKFGSFESIAAFDNIKRLYHWRYLNNAPLIVSVGLSESSILQPINDVIANNNSSAFYISFMLLGLMMMLVALIRRERIKRTIADEELARHQAHLEDTIASRTEELSHNEARTRTVLQTMHDGLVYIDSHGVILLINQSALRILGYSSDSELVGKNITSFIPDKELMLPRNPLGKYRPGGNSVAVVRPKVLEVKKSTGETISLEVAVNDLVDERGVTYICAVRDISVQIQTEKIRESARMEAERLAKVKGEFIANMSHEIRTPMNAIIGMADLTLLTELSSRQKNYLGKIKRASETLLKIINDLLDFSKIEAGKMTLEVIPFSLDDVFEQLSSIVAIRAEAQGIELLYDTENIPLTLMGDPLRLSQVLINLVTNAIKFSSDGNIIVRAETVNSGDNEVELHFSVSDQGVGISAVQIETLFQPFAQADSSTTRKYGGTGLGLAISRNIVEMMQGRLWVDSKVGEGSTFHFSVKLGTRSAKLSKERLGLDKKLAGYKNQTILVVDDNPTTLDTLGRVVRQLGFKPELASSATEAVGKFHSGLLENCLACVVDWRMPAADGIATIRILRSLFSESKARMPSMVLVTGCSQDSSIDEISHEIDGALSKPVSAHQLKAELGNCLGSKNKAQALSDRHEAEAFKWKRFSDLDILLVEDNEINQEVILELLAGVGISPRLAQNGYEAIDAIEARKPDVVLMDCHMPKMDGYSATSKIRENAQLQSLPIIALTANASTADKEKCFKSGMNAHVSKPIRLETLFDTLSQCIPEVSTSSEALESPHSQSQVKTEEGAPPHFPGIDLALGLSHVDGRFNLLVRVLKRFRDKYGKDFETDFAKASNASDWQAQEALAHSLKGVANTLGATALAELANELQGYAEAKDAAATAVQLKKVIDQLTVIVNGLNDIDNHIQGSV